LSTDVEGEARLSTAHQTLGAIMKGLRNRFGWTLKEMSEHSGIPLSTLSKVEHDRLTLTYDKLQQVSQRLKLPMSELFAEGAE
jgi:transcriptional regulator with XRE-family HTH domain